MSFAKQVWSTLSLIDTSDKVDKLDFGKVELDYLSWPWAWEELMKRYPESTWEMLPDTHLENKTVMTACRVTVRDGQNVLSREMHLPVMQHNKASKVNPSTREISDARMRCMVKCLALFGLGHNLYAGSDLPRLPTLEEAREEYKDAIETIQAGLQAYIDDPENEDALFEAAENFFTLPGEIEEILWVAPTKSRHAPWTTKMRTVIQSPEFKKAYYGEGEPYLGPGDK